MQNHQYFPSSLNNQSNELNKANSLEISALCGEKRMAEIPILPSTCLRKTH